MFTASKIWTFNKECESLRDTREFFARFVLKWLNNYEMVYNFHQLLDHPHKSSISDEDKMKIWKGTTEQMGVMKVEKVQELFDPLKIPCPVTKPQQFKKYVLSRLNKFTIAEKGRIEKLRQELYALIEKTPVVERPLLGMEFSSKEIFALLRKEAANKQ